MTKLSKEIRLKEYMFTFEAGGWNTVWAKTKRGAISKAKKEYKNSKYCVPRIDSFHIATESGLKVAMSNFY